MIASTVNWAQVRALVGLASRMNTRGHTGRTMYGRAISIITSYAISALYLAAMLNMVFNEAVYLIVSLLVTMYLAAYSVITSYHVILLDAEENTIMPLFPVNARTLFVSRIASFFLFSALLSAPFITPLAVVFHTNTHDLLRTTMYATVLTFAFFWTTAAALFLYNILILRFSSSKRLLAFLQTALIFLLLFFYQSLPSFATAQHAWTSFLASAWAPLFPMHWFAGMYYAGIRETVLDAQPLLAGIGLITTVLLVAAFRTRWVLLPDVQRAERAEKTETAHNRAFFTFLSARILRLPSRVRAGFDLFGIFLSRDRLLRMQFLPFMLMPVAIAVYGLFTSGLQSPFDGQIFWRSARLHVPILVFFLFSTRHVELTLFKAIHPETVWLLRHHTGPSLRDFARGVQLSVIIRIVLPVTSVLALLFCMTMPPADALLQAVFLLSASRFQNAALSLRKGRVPFTERETKLSSLHRFSQFFIIMPFVLVVTLLHQLLSDNRFLFIAGILALEFLTWILHAYSHRSSNVLPGAR